MNDVKRQYRSKLREEQARRTRERIADEARRLWVTEGFAGTTMDAIADAAGVAVQTVYAAFGTKGGILTALLNRLETEAGGETLIDDFRASPTPVVQLGLVARFNRRLFEGGADIIAIAIGSSAYDPEVAAWIAEGDRRRRDGQSRLVDQWHAAGALTIDVVEARDVLYALTSPELFLLLVRRIGWTAGRYERWLTTTLTQLLFTARPPSPAI